MCVSTLRLEPVSSTAVMLATGFIRLETAFPKFNIVAILVGGSVAYRYEELGEINAAKDWDGIILVREKVHITNLVNHARHYLCQMLSIVQEESQFLRTPKPTDPQWPNFDGVRFVGRTANGTKKGVKILSLEYFALSKTSLNILSFKDRRTYDSANPASRIQQVTSLDNNHVILHDQ